VDQLRIREHPLPKEHGTRVLGYLYCKKNKIGSQINYQNRLIACSSRVQRIGHFQLVVEGACVNVIRIGEGWRV
jgi:hypothetical protein